MSVPFLVKWFDFIKKRNMEEHYLLPNVWGRKETNPDIEAAVSLVSDRHYLRCLDAGTGLGHYAELLSPVCDHITATDISKRAIERAQVRLARLGNIDFKVANIRTMRPKEKFDLVVLADVLYYLGDERLPDAFEDLVQIITDMVTPNGRILITTFVTRGRNKDQALRYGKLFEKCGMHIERSEVFTHLEKVWVMQVLIR